MRVHGYRGLINRAGFGGTAAVVAEVEDTSKWKEGCDRDGRPIVKGDYAAIPQTTLTISDCSRSVNFEFYWETYEDRKNAMHKIYQLQRALRAFARGLAKEQELYVERMKRAPKPNG